MRSTRPLPTCTFTRKVFSNPTTPLQHGHHVAAHIRSLSCKAPAILLGGGTKLMHPPGSNFWRSIVLGRLAVQHCCSGCGEGCTALMYRLWGRERRRKETDGQRSEEILRMSRGDSIEETLGTSASVAPDHPSALLARPAGLHLAL